jgi:hypothetical protein
MIRIVSMAVLAAASLIVSVPALGAGVTTELPQDFTATILVTHATPKTGSFRIRFNVEKWTTDDEKITLAKALKEGGADRLVEEMGKLSAGTLVVDDNLRFTIRTATTWQSPKGQHFRLATNRPIRFGEYWRNLNTRLYPFGIVEFVLPPGVEGSGSLLVAAAAVFNEKGQIEIRSLPENTGPQMLTNVVRHLPKQSQQQ